MLPELLIEIEEKFRQIIREEVKAALSESKNTNLNFDSNFNLEKEEINKVEDKTSNIQKDYPQIVTAQEIARILGVDVQRVYELTRQRKSNGLPVIVLGERQYRYSKEAILKWMERDYK